MAIMRSRSLQGEELQRREPKARPRGMERRGSKRRPAFGSRVDIEAPAVSGDLHWSGRAVDVNGDGMGLVMPPELPPGSLLLLTLRLDEKTELRRVPSVVVRQDDRFGVGAVRFERWPTEERLKLLSFLLQD